MIHIRKEGEPVKQGFNFYPLSDAGSFGFISQIKRFRFVCRYSKINKKWIIRKAQEK